MFMFNFGWFSEWFDDVVVSMSNLGLQMFSLALIAVGIVSMLVIDFNRSVLRKLSPFHY